MGPWRFSAAAGRKKGNCLKDRRIKENWCLGRVQVMKGSSVAGSWGRGGCLVLEKQR